MENTNKQELAEEEMINCVDKQGNIVGTVERNEGINRGVLLQAAQLWIINPKTKKVLMQRRSAKKENDANMIDASVSGHVKKNEIPTQAILREAFEEIGMIPTELFSKLQTLNKIEVDFSKIGRKGRYIAHEYLAFFEYPLEYYKKQDEEVDELFFWDYEKVKQEIRNKNPNMRIPYIKETEELFKMLDKKINQRKEEKEKCEEK